MRIFHKYHKAAYLSAPVGRPVQSDGGVVGLRGNIQVMKYIPRKGEKVYALGKTGIFTVFEVDTQRALADLELACKVAGKGYIARNVPFGHIHPVRDDED